MPVTEKKIEPIGANFASVLFKLLFASLFSFQYQNLVARDSILKHAIVHHGKCQIFFWYRQ